MAEHPPSEHFVVLIQDSQEEIDDYALLDSQGQDLTYSKYVHQLRQQGLTGDKLIQALTAGHVYLTPNGNPIHLYAFPVPVNTVAILISYGMPEIELTEKSTPEEIRTYFEWELYYYCEPLSTYEQLRTKFNLMLETDLLDAVLARTPLCYYDNLDYHLIEFSQVISNQAQFKALA